MVKKIKSEKIILIGEFLKQEREAKGITLEVIASRTKINYNILKNLEADNIEALPNIAYVKGFVQNYVKIIHGDLDTALERLSYSYQLNNEVSERPIAKLTEAKLATESTEQVHSNNKINFGDKVIELYEKIKANRKAIVICAGLAVSVYTIHGAYTYISDSVTKNIFSSNTASSKDIKSKEAKLLEQDKYNDIRKDVSKNIAAVSPTVKETVKSTKVDTEQEIRKEEKKVIALKISKFPFFQFRKINSDKIYKILSNSDQNSDLDLLPKEYRDRVDSKKQNVFINALFDKTWLSYSIDDGRIKSVILSQGNQLFLQGQKVIIFLGNVNATKVFYNNQLVDPLSKTGVKSLIFPEKIIRGHYLPLFKSNADGILYKAQDYINKMDAEKEKTEEV
jgi:cytoskeleton protein RodZ